MPVIINEIEVLEQPPASAHTTTPPPKPAPTQLLGDAVIRLVRDAAGRQDRRVAD